METLPIPQTNTDDEPLEWDDFSIYATVDMKRVAEVLARREKRRLRLKKYGAGRVWDAAMREYVERRLSPHELAAVLAEGGDATR